MYSHGCSVDPGLCTTLIPTRVSRMHTRTTHVFVCQVLPAGDIAERMSEWVSVCATRVGVCVCLFPRYMCLYIHIFFAWVYASMCACTYACVHVCMQVCVCVCICGWKCSDRPVDQLTEFRNHVCAAPLSSCTQGGSRWGGCECRGEVSWEGGLRLIVCVRICLCKSFLFLGDPRAVSSHHSLRDGYGGGWRWWWWWWWW